MKKHILLIGVILLLHSVSSFSQKLDTLVLFRNIQRKNVEIKKTLKYTECGDKSAITIIHVLLVKYNGIINKADFKDGNFLNYISPLYYKKNSRFKKTIISNAYLYDNNGSLFAISDGNPESIYCFTFSRDSNVYLKQKEKILLDLKPKIAFNITCTSIGVIFVLTETNEMKVIINDKEKIVCSIEEFVELYWSKSRFITEKY